jgi:phosphatidylserine/phosphatidylglycerophosphate/cardiolipin synthase-like enzyme
LSSITKVTAIANNEIAVIAWQVDGMIPNCLGFEITRIYVDGAEKGQEKVLPAWVAFKGQRNPDWKPQTTSVWPVQKLVWRDLTLRKHRSGLDRRDIENLEVKYRVRPVATKGSAANKVPTPADASPYEGDPVPLYYVDDGLESNAVTISITYGDQITAAFTNGILSTQWLSHTLDDLKTKGSKAGKAIAKVKTDGHTKSEQTAAGIKAIISDVQNPVRAYLAGDVPAVVTSLPEQAKDEGRTLHLALYELSDKQLIDAIKGAAATTHLILSNTGVNRVTGQWDGENTPARKALRPMLASLQDRMFNNAGHIGHNKFAVLLDKHGKPQSVLTGSTNWTPNGLCAQSNNALVIHAPELAQQYLDYWNDISADTKDFARPKPLSEPTSNVQGPDLRQTNKTKLPAVTLADGTTIRLWRSPNTAKKTKGTAVPPDLAEVYSLMAQAKEAIFFAVYYPSGGGLTSVIEQAVTLGQQDPNLLVYGAISDPKAMWQAANPGESEEDAPTGTKAKDNTPSTFDDGNIHLTLARALSAKNAPGDFEKEMLSAGFAIIHDKIVVIDPMGDNPTIITGSHNLGFKASYCNDDNLVIIRGNKRLAQAYCAHIIDLYDHYRFRAVEEEIAKKGGAKEDGFLSTDSKWLKSAIKTPAGTLADYLTK